MTGQARWPIRLAAAATADMAQIVRWSVERFGDKQARAYATTLSMALSALSAGPSIAGVRRRDDIGKGLLALHVGRAGRKGRHFVIFRIGRDDRDRKVIEVLRILHDAMDLPSHVPPGDEP